MKQYRLLLLATAVFWIQDGAMFVILPVYTLSLSDSYFLVGAMISIPFLGNFLMNYFWGYLSDRTGNRMGLMVTATMVGALFFPLFVIENVYIILGVRLIQIFFLTAWNLSTTAITEAMPTAYGKGIGMLGFTTGIGWFTGSTLSGFIYSQEPIYLFMMCMATTVTANIILLTADRTAIIDTIRRSRFLNPASKGRTATSRVSKGSMLPFDPRQKKLVSRIVGTIFFIEIGNGLDISQFMVYFRSLGADFALLGILGGLATIVNVFAMIIVGRWSDRVGRRKLFRLALVTYIFIFTGYALATHLPLIVILWMWPGWAFIYISMATMVSDITTEAQRARGLGTIYTFQNLGIFFGSLMSGFAMDQFDLTFRQVFGFATIFGLIAFVIGLQVRETLVKKSDAGSRSDPID